MKFKNLICFVLISALSLAFASCNKNASPKSENKAEAEQPGTAQSRTAEYTELRKIDENGFYSFEYNQNNGNIMFYDFASQTKIYLCSALSCAHNTQACQSYSAASRAAVFTNGENLFLIEHPENENPYISVMNKDGSNKRKFFTAADGQLLGVSPDINALYAAGSGSSLCFMLFDITNNSLTLVKVDTDDGSCQELAELDASALIQPLSVYENKLVYYTEGMPEGALSAGGAVSCKIVQISLDNGEQEVVDEWAKNFGEGEHRVNYVDAGKYYYLITGEGENVGRLYELSLATKEKRLVAENCPTRPKGITWEGRVGSDFISNVIDGEIIITTEKDYQVKDTSEIAADRYAVNLETGEMRKLSLAYMESNSLMPIKIVGQFKDNLLALTESRWTDYLAPDNQGVMQTYYREEIIYSVISKQDYLSNTPNYKEIVSAE